MSIVFVKGEMHQFVAQREFSLNFEDRKIKSVKVKQGEALIYDGDTVTYPADGETPSTGRCPSLKAAINAGWLVSSNGKVKTAPVKTQPVQKGPGDKDFDDVTGGNFETFLKEKGLNGDAKEQAASRAKTAAGIKKPGPEVLPTSKKEFDDLRGGSFEKSLEKDGINRVSKVINHEDRIVKRHAEKAPEAQPGRPARREVVNQRSVRDIDTGKSGPISVTSSTSQPGTNKHSSTVIQSGSYGASHVEIQMKGVKKASADAGKRKTFTVDGSTLSSIPEDFTADEVAKATGGASGKATVMEAQDNQQATVVKKIGVANTKVSVEDMDRAETRVVKKIGVAPTVTTEEGITLRKTESRESIGEAKVSAGETMPPMGGEVTVIKKGTAQQVKTASQKPAGATTGEKADYLSMLPDDWGTMHWVQKEKFIQGLDNKGLIEFIMSVDIVKAVLVACKERLRKLG